MPDTAAGVTPVPDDQHDPHHRDLFADLEALELRPFGAKDGVAAVCRRHPGEVVMLVSGSLTQPPGLGSLALQGLEHLRDQHQGPSLCCCTPGADPHPGCTEHGRVAEAFRRSDAYGNLLTSLARQLGAIGDDAHTDRPGDEKRIKVALLKALYKARVALTGARRHDTCPTCSQADAVAEALAALDGLAPARGTA